MENTGLWSDMLDMLKDIRNYLEKQDAKFETAEIAKRPKAGETMNPIEGGPALSTKPADNPIPMKKASISEGPFAPKGAEALKEEGASMLKEKDEDEEVKEVSPEESRESESSGSDEELKSLLKDIRSQISKQVSADEITKQVLAEVKKQMPNLVKSETDKMLRKQGFNPTHPDVMRLGVDQISQPDIKKSEEEVKKVETDELTKANKNVDDMSKLSWQQLGQMAEKAGLFTPFQR